MKAANTQNATLHAALLSSASKPTALATIAVAAASIAQPSCWVVGIFPVRDGHDPTVRTNLTNGLDIEVWW